MMESELETFGGDFEEYPIWRENFLAYQDASFQRVTETNPDLNLRRELEDALYKELAASMESLLYGHTRRFYITTAPLSSDMDESNFAHIWNMFDLRYGNDLKQFLLDFDINRAVYQVGMCWMWSSQVEEMLDNCICIRNYFQVCNPGLLFNSAGWLTKKLAGSIDININIYTDF